MMMECATARSWMLLLLASAAAVPKVALAQHCHASPSGWTSVSGWSCEHTGVWYGCSSHPDDAANGDGLLATDSCCECGGGSSDVVMSCVAPTGTSWAEASVDCAAHGLEPIAQAVFQLERECEGGECGVDDCCIPIGCHNSPADWTTSWWDYNCEVAAERGLCVGTNGASENSDGLHAMQACCACGGGSSEVVMSCIAPTGTSWEEAPVDCAAVGLRPLIDSVFEQERECAGGECGIDDCCILPNCHASPSDWTSDALNDCTQVEDGIAACSQSVVSSDGISSSDACCACGGGSSDVIMSCVTPTGRDRNEAPIDCEAAGLHRLPDPLFGQERDCAEGACGVADCCMPELCHGSPTNWTSAWGFDCVSTASQGYCFGKSFDASANEDGVLAIDACCECGGGSGDLIVSCITPTGSSWDEAPVDCAAAGLEPLPYSLFAQERDCQGPCGLAECCIPARCHDFPNWVGGGGVRNCDDARRLGICLSDNDSWKSDEGVSAKEACCDCGGGSNTVIMSCMTPTRTSWDEAPVDCLRAGLRPLADSLLRQERECVSGTCGVMECCVPTHCHDMDWTSYHGDDCESVGFNFLGSRDTCLDGDSRSDDGVLATEACCECGGGSTEVVMSCFAPMGRSWEEDPVDCAVVGLNMLPMAMFERQQDCTGGVCSVADCCIPANCHATPSDWLSIAGHSCGDIANNGDCSSNDQTGVSADGVLAIDACCECGGGSSDIIMSCVAPTGTSWAESPVNCAIAGLAPIPARLFEQERECEGGECSTVECCVPENCHNSPSDWTDAACSRTARRGWCFHPTRGVSDGGVLATDACCECGGGSDEIFMSCATPTGSSWDEAPVDCSAVGRVPLPKQSFNMERDCEDEECGVTECCMPANCHASPTDWISQSFQSCASVEESGNCLDPENGVSADGTLATVACCECGGGSSKIIMSCVAPTGTSWAESPVDCCAAGLQRIPEAMFVRERVCESGECGIAECCVPKLCQPTPHDWVSSVGYVIGGGLADCAYVEAHGYCELTRGQVTASEDGTLATEACCGCGGGSREPFMSCATPSGTTAASLRGEQPVDCAAVGLEPLDASAFDLPRECTGGRCGIEDCCIAIGCQAAPLDWVSDTFTVSYTCADVERLGICLTNPVGGYMMVSADGTLATDACCGCGGGSTEGWLPTCTSPTGTPGEQPLNCHSHGRLPLAEYSTIACGEERCTLDHCCSPPNCHTSPLHWKSDYGFDCATIERRGDCFNSDYSLSAQNVPAATACCGCGGGSSAPLATCETPTANPARDRPVDCSAAGRRPLSAFGQTACPPGGCTLDTCCVPVHCHSMPLNWQGPAGYDCFVTELMGYCNIAAPSGETPASEACCACGGGSTAPFPQCSTPTGLSWDEEPIVCPEGMRSRTADPNAPIRGGDVVVVSDNADEVEAAFCALRDTTNGYAPPAFTLGTASMLGNAYVVTHIYDGDFGEVDVYSLWNDDVAGSEWPAYMPASVVERAEASFASRGVVPCNSGVCAIDDCCEPETIGPASFICSSVADVASSTAIVNAACCPPGGQPGSGHRRLQSMSTCSEGGTPTTCSDECATIWMSYRESCFTFLPVDEQLSLELTQFTRKCAGKVCNTQASFNKHIASLDSACCGVDGSGCVNGLPTTCEKAMYLRPSHRLSDANSRATCLYNISRRRHCMCSQAGSTPHHVRTVPRLARRRSDASRDGGGGCTLHECIQWVGCVA